MRRGQSIAGRFEIDRRAGVGGMGIVYRALDRLSDRPVAIKLLLEGPLAEHRRFAREAALLAELRHPSIVQYLDHGVLDTGELFLVMEWVEGVSLTERLREGPLSVEETVTLAVRLAGALAVAHRLGVVHRDIKPGNVLLPGGRLGEAKLLDFGIARRLEQTGSVTETGVLVGTLRFMSPEQARDPRAVDARTDVYSLGVVLFECLAGRRAFPGEDAPSVLGQIIFQDPPRASGFVPGIPPSVDDLVRAMMDRDPARRPADGEAVQRAFAELGSLAGTEAPPDSVGLTAEERRLVTVLLVAASEAREPSSAAATASTEASTAVSDEGPTRVVAPRPASSDGAPTRVVAPDQAPAEPSGAEARGLETLAVVAGRYGGRAHLRPDGTVLVTFEEVAAGWDEHDRAALCALGCRSHFGGARLALAAGSAVTSTRRLAGSVVERARDALASAEPGSIRLDPQAAALVERRFRIRLDADGATLLAPRSDESGVRPVLGREPPCVGRRRELAMLEATFEEAAGEPVARAVVVVGEAGIGKSRLLREFAEGLANGSEAPLVLRGRADWIAAGSPFSLLGSAMRQTAGIAEADALELARQKLRSRVAESGIGADAAAVTTAFLGEIARVPFPVEVSPALAAARQNPVIMGDRMRTAFEDLLLAECERAPVVLLLEDLHWADGPSVSLVDAALRGLADRPLVVVATARPDVAQLFPELWAARHPQQIRLAPLTRKASEQLLRELAGDDLPERALDGIAARSGGNPLFLEEFARVLADAKTGAIPDTLQGVVQARLDGLAPATRRVLRAAAVFGQAFWVDGVAALAGIQTQADEVEAALAELERQELVVRSRESMLPGQRQYRFEHDLLREAAYRMLTDEDRALGHRLAGQWLERAGEQDPVILASHYTRGQAPASALPWFRLGAEQALEGNDLREAIARADEALRCQPATRLAGELELIRAEALRLLGEYAAGAKAGHRALERLPEGSTAWFRATQETAAAHFHQGQHDAVAALLAEVERVAPAEDAPPAKVAALCLIGWFVHHGGEVEVAARAIAAAEEIVAAHAVEAPWALAWLHAVRAMRGFFRGDLAEYLADSERAVAHLEAAGDARTAAHQRVNVAVGYAQTGQYGRAASLLGAVIATAERFGLRKLVVSAELQLAQARLDLAEFDEAAHAARRAHTLAREIGSDRLMGVATGLLGEVAAHQGRPAEAEAELRRALELLASAPSYRAEVLESLARLRLAEDEPAAALALVDEAQGLVDSIGGLGPSEYRLILTRFEVLSRVGRADEAGAQLRVAATRLRDQAAGFSDDALRMSFLRDVPTHARILRLAPG